MIVSMSQGESSWPVRPTMCRSRRALSGESEAWAPFRIRSRPKSLRTVPGSALVGSVEPEDLADLVDGVGAFVQQGQALGPAGGGLLVRVVIVVGVHAGHVLDDRLNSATALRSASMVGHALGVGIVEGEVERVVQAARRPPGVDVAT